MEGKFIEKCERFNLYHNDLLDLGFKNKEIAKELGLYPSAYSSLINKVIIPIIEASDTHRNLGNYVEECFATTNNLSEMKIRRHFNSYLQKMLELIKSQAPLVDEKKKLNGNEKYPLQNRKIINLMEGIYDCYYLSSFGYRIKREPLMIKYCKQENIILVIKGNDLSPSKYRGRLTLSNNFLLTMDLLEKNTVATDHFLAHFHLPPTYDTTMKILRGVAINMSNSNLPIARKLILDRVSDHVDLDDYKAIKTEFYTPNKNHDNTIIAYLSQQYILDYLPIPYPTFTTKDLMVEVEIREDYNTKLV